MTQDLYNDYIMAVSERYKNTKRDQTMKYSTSVKPISYLKTHASEVLRNLAEDKQPMIITQNGEAKTALLDIHEYEGLLESMAMLKLISQSKKSIADNEVTPFREVCQSIKEGVAQQSS